MRIPEKNPLMSLVGVGSRTEKTTGKKELVTSFYPNHYEHVVRSFEVFPIRKIFGISIDEAMRMPIDRWWRIKKLAEKMPENKHTNIESELLELVKKIIEVRGVQ